MIDIIGTLGSRGINANPINIEDDDAKGNAREHEILREVGPSNPPHN